MAGQFSLEYELMRRRKAAKELVGAYEGLKTVFETQIHPAVTSAATGADGIFLTDHGPDHIKTVIDRASRLVSQSSIKLSTYEMFLLLCAIHLHDVGNALGRRNHEQKADEIMKLAYGPLGFDQLNKFMAMNIAAVHGGSIGGDRDTIKNIEETTTWKNEQVRPQYLAAILRLADELAEDRHRANSVGVELGNIVKHSEAHHIFAYGLHSFEPDAGSFTIDVRTAYARSYFLKSLGKGSGEVSLIDEIYVRTMKTFEEALYCSRYLRGGLRFDRVKVTIDVLDDEYRTRIKQIAYVLEEHGYRSRKPTEIFSLSRELANYEGNGPLTSERLTRLLETDHATAP